jgi:hypothetical protein
VNLEGELDSVGHVSVVVQPVKAVEALVAHGGFQQRGLSQRLGALHGLAEPPLALYAAPRQTERERLTHEQLQGQRALQPALVVVRGAERLQQRRAAAQCGAVHRGLRGWRLRLRRLRRQPHRLRRAEERRRRRLRRHSTQPHPRHVCERGGRGGGVRGEHATTVRLHEELRRR